MIHIVLCTIVVRECIVAHQINMSVHHIDEAVVELDYRTFARSTDLNVVVGDCTC